MGEGRHRLPGCPVPPHVGAPVATPVQDLATTYLERLDQRDLAVFDTRLGLAVLDVVESSEDPAARVLVAKLHRRAMNTSSGYAAREALRHPLFTAVATDREAQDLRTLVDACALETGRFPEELSNQLDVALCTSNGVIRQSLAHPERLPADWMR